MAAGFDLPRLFNTLTQVFRARPSTADVSSLQDSVVPVYETWRILHDIIGDYLSANISAGAVTLYTCPQGKRAEIYTVWRQLTAGATRVQVERAAAADGIPAWATVSGTVELSIVGLVVPMSPGDTLKIRQGAAGDTAIGTGFTGVEWDYRP